MPAEEPVRESLQPARAFNNLGIRIAPTWWRWRWRRRRRRRRLNPVKRALEPLECALRAFVGKPLITEARTYLPLRSIPLIAATFWALLAQLVRDQRHVHSRRSSPRHAAFSRFGRCAGSAAICSGVQPGTGANRSTSQRSGRTCPGHASFSQSAREYSLACSTC